MALAQAEVHDLLFGHDVRDEELLHDDLDVASCSCSRVVYVTKRPALGPSVLSLPDGGVCFACGGMTVRTGSCTTCQECGETGGCG